MKTEKWLNCHNVGTSFNNRDKIFCIFGSTYNCEQVFSTMKIIKNKTRSRITNEHFYAVLRINSSRLEPNIDVFCE